MYILKSDNQKHFRTQSTSCILISIYVTLVCENSNFLPPQKPSWPVCGPQKIFFFACTRYFKFTDLLADCSPSYKKVEKSTCLKVTSAGYLDDQLLLDVIFSFQVLQRYRKNVAYLFANGTTHFKMYPHVIQHPLVSALQAFTRYPNTPSTLSDGTGNPQPRNICQLQKQPSPLRSLSKGCPYLLTSKKIVQKVATTLKCIFTGGFSISSEPFQESCPANMPKGNLFEIPIKIYTQEAKDSFNYYQRFIL